MLLQRRSWLWLYIRIGVILGDILGRKPSIREQHGGNSCYQLNRLFCDFQEADNYCHAQRGRLAHTWNPKLRGFLKSFLNEETVWWVRGNLTLPGSHPGINQTGRALVLNVEGKSFLGLCYRVEESHLWPFHFFFFFFQITF